MQYLEEMEDNKLYINCLLFWREVQEYKTLFVQESFSPCAVEMKAKVWSSTKFPTTTNSSCYRQCLVATSVLDVRRAFRVFQRLL